jgi:hypothetical protein
MCFLSCVLAPAAALALAQQRPLTIPRVRSGHAELVQKGRLTILELASPGGPVQRIALTHPSDYPRGADAPFDARLIAESPHRFLIFTDTFASNPWNIQGQCGASESGERLVHVVALGAFPHETLSALVDSCLLDLEPTPGSPEWHAKPDSAGFVGQLILRFGEGTHPTTVYYVASDGSVSRPGIKSNP